MNLCELSVFAVKLIQNIALITLSFHLLQKPIGIYLLVETILTLVEQLKSRPVKH